MTGLINAALQYSNAVMVAVLPHIGDFAKKMELPMPVPITANQVFEFKYDPRPGHVGGRLTLTNGAQFWFGDGYVNSFRTPKSYYSLQDPARTPEFFGSVNISKDEAVQIARAAIKKLGYADKLPIQDIPFVTLPEKIGTNLVARYRVRWESPPDSPKKTFIDIEVNASDRRIHKLTLFDDGLRRPDPKIEGIAKEQELKDQHSGGVPVTKAATPYATAFLTAVLPELSRFSSAAGLFVKTPISTNDIDYNQYVCVSDGQRVTAWIGLKNGDKFVFDRGYICAYYASNAFDVPDEQRSVEAFTGKVNLSTNEAITIARRAFAGAGYSEALHTEVPPELAPPTPVGTNMFARFFVLWGDKNASSYKARIEIDATTKVIKSMYASHPKLWRETPKIAVPFGQK